MDEVEVEQDDAGYALEECFYCGELGRRVDIDRYGMCNPCMTANTQQRELAARQAQGACYTQGPHPQRMF
jgi:hypothetical protein